MTRFITTLSVAADRRIAAQIEAQRLANLAKK